MSIKNHSVKQMLAILVVGVMGAVTAQTFNIGIDGGLSQPVGTEMTRWNTGFSGGTNIFYLSSGGMGIGLRLGYDRWTPNKAKFTAGADSLLNPEVKGSTSIFEFIPMLRLSSTDPMSPVNFFGHVGTGLYAIRATSNVTGLVSGNQRDVEFDNGKWIGRWGFQMGPGVSIGDIRSFTFDVFPLYNVVFNGNHVFQYFIVNAGITLRLGGSNEHL